MDRVSQRRRDLRTGDSNCFAPDYRRGIVLCESSQRLRTRWPSRDANTNDGAAVQLGRDFVRRLRVRRGCRLNGVRLADLDTITAVLLGKVEGSVRPADQRP